MMKPLMILVTMALATPTFAQQSFAVPEGCEAKLTVQHKGCVVLNVWTCKADDPGDQWLAIIGQGGLFSMQRVDSNFQWVESFKLTGNERLQIPATDPASLDELFETQLDTWDFTLETDDGTERNVGFDMLTGDTTEIDGELLLNTEYVGRTLDSDGNELDNGSGRQFVSETHRLFFFGEAWDEATPDQITDMSPVEFVYPGEAGFFASEPKYECNQVETGYRP